MIANTAFDIEKGSPAECNRACTIPFPVPVSHIMCEIGARHTFNICPGASPGTNKEHMLQAYSYSLVRAYHFLEWRVLQWQTNARYTTVHRQSNVQHCTTTIRILHWSYTCWDYPYWHFYCCAPVISLQQTINNLKSTNMKYHIQTKHSIQANRLNQLKNLWMISQKHMHMNILLTSTRIPSPLTQMIPSYFWRSREWAISWAWRRCLVSESILHLNFSIEREFTFIYL
jgi:hypothetical protein